MELDLVGKAMLNILNDLSPHTITYERLLQRISEYAIGSEMHISYLEYEINKKIYDKAVKEGYILNKIEDISTYRFLIIKTLKTKKVIDENIINLYFS